MNYELPKKYWEERDAVSSKMPKDELLPLVEKFIAAHNVMALATSHDDIVRNTPVEYSYRNGAFYFLSEGGKKFDGLEVNKNVSLAIFDQMTKGICRGLQVVGTATLIDSTEEEYTDYFRSRNLKPDAFSSRVPYPIPLIRVDVESFDYFDWALSKQKYSMRQHIGF